MFFVMFDNSELKKIELNLPFFTPFEYSNPTFLFSDFLHLPTNIYVYGTWLRNVENIFHLFYGYTPWLYAVAIRT